MNRYIKISVITLVLVLLALAIVIPGRKIARKHVNYITAVEDHPLSCTSCHLYNIRDGIISKILNADYYSPLNLAVSGDEKFVYAVAQDGNALIIADTRTGKAVKKIMVGSHPHSVIINKAGNKAYVSNQWSDNISVIDLPGMKVTDTIQSVSGPAGIALSRDERYLYVVNSFTSDLSVIDLNHKEEIKRLITGNNPTGIHISNKGLIYVTSRRNMSAPYGEILKTEVTVVSDSTQRIHDRIYMESAHLIENVFCTPEGDMAFVTLIRPKNMVPSIQVERGFMMTHGIGVIDMKSNTVQFLLDEPNAYYPDPFDIVISPDGKKGFISNSGVDCISVVDIDSIRRIINDTSPELLKSYSNNLGTSRRFVVKRIPSGSNPKGLALSPDGKRLYVANQLDDNIQVINTETLEASGNIDLGGPRRITVARQGRRLLNNAGHTFQNQFSCYTCHPDTHEDGLVYNMASKDMGRNVTNTQSLRDLSETPPYKWNGMNQTVYKQDGIRFSTILTRTEQFSYKNLDAIVSYILTGIISPPNLQNNPDGVLTESQLNGKKIYERDRDNFGNHIPEFNRCITCHPPPYYTNLKLADVSTLAATDDSMLFDTPHLTNIHMSPPYLHDGRAATLEEIWTLYGKDDRHGLTSDMTKGQLNDLINYLNSLASPEYKKKYGDDEDINRSGLNLKITGKNEQ